MLDQEVPADERATNLFENIEVGELWPVRIFVMASILKHVDVLAKTLVVAQKLLQLLCLTQSIDHRPTKWICVLSVGIKTSVLSLKGGLEPQIVNRTWLLLSKSSHHILVQIYLL